MTAKELVDKAKTKLVMGKIFWASLALPLSYREDTTIKSACTNGKEVRYNPAFVESLDIQEAMTLIAHEAGHGGLLHHLRLGDRNPDLFNKAADYVVNLHLRDSEFVLPPHVLIDNRFKGMSVEHVYSILEREQQDNDDGDKQDDNQQQQSGGGDDGNGQPQNGDNGDDSQQDATPWQDDSQSTPQEWGGVEQYDYEAEGQTQSEAEAEARQILVDALDAAQSAGTVPAGMETTIEKLVETTVPWEEVLQRFLTVQANNDYTWSTPNRRFLAMGFYLPALKNLEIGGVVFSIDASGSVTSRIRLVEKIVSELQSASAIFKIPTTVIQCDTEIQDTVDLEPDTVINVIGGGGTDFVPPFVWVNENMPDTKAMVYLTDGMCRSFPKEPDYPTLWCVYDNDDFEPPFGEVLIVE